MTASGTRTVIGSRQMAAAVAGTFAVAAVGLGVWAWWDLTIDDAYITFRYSQHLADGHGPVWNIGEDPVQGYTNLLWMLLLTVPAWLGWSLPVVAKILGVAALAGTTCQVFRAVVDWSGGRRWAGWAAGATLLGMVPSYVHAVAGLETMLYAGLLLRFVWAVCMDRSPAERVALALLLGICRPEGFAVAGLGLLYAAWRDRGPVWPLAVSGLAVVGLVGWQWWYYGYPLANTFYAKLGPDTVHLGLVVVVVASALLWLAVPGGPSRPWVAIAAPVAVAPYVVSTLSMDYAMRFTFHVVPLLLAVVFAAIARVEWRWRRPAALAVAVAWGVAGAVAVGPDLDEYGARLRASHVTLGEALAEWSPNGGTVAVGDAGAIPFHSGWDVIDTWGLNDEKIAHGVAPTVRVVAAQPDVVVAYLRPETGLTLTVGPDPQLEQLLSREYEVVMSVPTLADYELAVFVRADALGEVVDPQVLEGRHRLLCPPVPAGDAYSVVSRRQ